MRIMRVILAVLLFAASVAASETSPREAKPVNRRSFESSPASRSFGTERRPNNGPLSNSDAPTSTQYFGRGTQPLTIRHPRPASQNRRQRPQSIPPYAVQMEPLVQYSQPDPLFDQEKSKQVEKTSAEHAKKTTSAPANALPVERKLSDAVKDSAASASLQLPRSPVFLSPDQPVYQDIAESHHQHIYLNQNHHHHHEELSQHYDHGQYHSREPEPIIEIIIQESNVTLPPPPAQPIHPVPQRKKEPVQVFYVKYKKNPNGYGKDDVIYDKPVPAVTPATNNAEEDDHHERHSAAVEHHVEHTTVLPTPRTTLRTIIRPDSETFHGGAGIHVTFGDPHGDLADTAHGESVQQSAPQPAVLHLKHAPAPVPVAQQRQGLEQFAGFPTHPQKRHPEPFQQGQGQHPFQQLPPQPFQPQNSVSFPRSNSQPFHSKPQFQPPHPAFSQQLPFNNQPAQFRPNQQQQPTQQQHFPSPTPSEFDQPPPPPRHNQFQQPPQFNQRPPHQFQPQPPQPFQQAGPPQLNAHNQRPNFQNGPPQEHHQRPPQFPTQPAYQTIPDNILRSNPPQHHHQQQQHANNQQHQPQIQHHHPQPSINSQQQLNQQQQHQQQQQQQQLQHQRQQQQQQQQQHLQQQQQKQQQQQQANKHQHLEILGGPKFNGEIIKSLEPVLGLHTQEKHQQFPQTSSRNVAPQQTPPQPQPQQQRQQFQQPPQQHSQQFFQQHQQQQQPQQQQQQQQNFPTPPQQQQNFPTAPQQQQQHQLQRQQQQFGNNHGQQTQQVQQQIQIINQQLQQNPLPFQQATSPSQAFATQTARPPTQNTAQPPKLSQPLFHPQPASPFKVQSSLPKLPSQNLASKVSPKYSFSTPKAEPVTTTKPIVVQDSQVEIDEEKEKEKQAKIQSSLAAFPDEVPDEIRQQLISAGILGNADIQILDYDKVGDIPIDKLPPHALENFYSAGGRQAAGSAPVPSVLRADAPRASPGSTTPPTPKPVEMKVVRYDPSTAEGKQVADQYVRDDATHVDPVVLNDSRYNRYLPLKVVGTQFPLPDVPELRGRNVTSVVVLAPVDYDFLQKAQDDGASAADLDRLGRAAPVEVQGVRFVAGEILKELVKNPTRDNYQRWLQQEQATPSDRQSIVLLVAGPAAGEDPTTKEIFMYDVSTQKVSKLRGELSSAFVDVAEANAGSQDLDNISIPPGASAAQGEEAAASDVAEQRVKFPGPAYRSGFVDTPTGVEDLSVAASELQDVAAPVNRVLISSSYSKSTKSSHAKK